MPKFQFARDSIYLGPNQNKQCAGHHVVDCSKTSRILLEYRLRVARTADETSYVSGWMPLASDYEVNRTKNEFMLRSRPKLMEADFEKSQLFTSHAAKENKSNCKLLKNWLILLLSIPK